MKSFNNILVIYPVDSTIDFLEPIVNTITSVLPQTVVVRPLAGSSFNSISDDTELVIFLGHGTTRELFGGANKNGEKSKLFDIQNGALLFDECSVVLFSCNSVDYLKNMKANPISIENFFAFGDMPTDEEHVKHNQENFKDYWLDYNEEQLDYYKEVLVSSVIYGIKKAVKTDSFHGFYKGINHIVNMKLNEVLLEKKWTKSQKNR